MNNTDATGPVLLRSPEIRDSELVPPRRVPRWWRDASAATAWVLILAVVGLWIGNRGLQDLFGTAGDALISAGRLIGLIASALLLAQVFLMARVPAIERAWGQDGLTRLHRTIGFGSFTLLLGHIALITLGYAAADPGRVWSTFVDFTLNYPGMLLALAGTAALILVVVTSARFARRRLRYESWHLIHLYAYLGAGLALPHQLWTGQEFLASPVATVFWWTLYAVCAASVLIYRIAVPLWRSIRGRIRVVAVRQDSDTVTTVTLGGSGIRYLRAQGGQYFQFRFLDGAGWSRAHPYSLSAAPNGTTLRVTAAVVGDGTAHLASLRPGVRVLVEGPYGRMHPGTRTRRRVLLIGAGIGITPMRSLLESLPQSPGDVMVIDRVRSPRDAILSGELLSLAAQLGADYLMIDGHRNRERISWLPDHAAAWDDAAALVHICPDVADRDVFVCGPPPWAGAVRNAARRAGTPSDHVYIESFEL